MQMMKVGDRLRTSLTGSETVVRVESTQTLMYSMHTFNWMANKVWGQVGFVSGRFMHVVRVGVHQWHWLSILICTSGVHLVQCLCGVTLHE